MAQISPMCSIMEAMAIGAITSIAVMSNLQIWKGGSPSALASETVEKSRIAVPPGFVTPHK